MSQIPPPFDPIPYASPGFRPPDPRPTSVTVIAILAIIWGSLSVLGLLCTIPQYMGVKFGPNPVMDGIRNDPTLFGFMMVTMGIGLVLAILLLAGGIGALSLKPSARSMLIWYSVLYLVTGILGLLLNILWINPRMEQVVNQSFQLNPQLNNPGMRAGIRYSTYGGMCFGLLLLIWPVVVLYFMSRPHVKAAFGVKGEDSATAKQ